MVAVKFENFKNKTIEVSWPPVIQGKPVFPVWEKAPGVVAGQDVAAITSSYLNDCDMVTVPSDFQAMFGGHYKFLTVRHVDATNVESPEQRVVGVSIMTPIVYVRDFMMRVCFASEDIMACSVLRLRPILPKVASMWEALRKCGQVVGGEQNVRALFESIREGEGVRRQDEVFVLMTTGGPSKENVKVDSSIDLKDGEADDAEMKAAKLIARRGEKIAVRDLVCKKQSMETVADLLAYWGVIEEEDLVLDESSMYMQMMTVVTECVEANETGAKTKSAMKRAMVASAVLFHAGIVRYIRRALRDAKFREYSCEQAQRLEEFCRLIDLDSGDKEVSDEAFKMTLKTLIRAHPGVSYILENSASVDEAFGGYKVLSMYFVSDAENCLESTIGLLENKVSGLAHRCRMEASDKVSVSERVQTVLGFGAEAKDSEQRAGTVAFEENSKGDDSAVGGGVGRRLTKTDLHEMAQMRSHALWGKLVNIVKGLEDMGATTSDYVEAQLKAELPVVRQQLFCLIQVPGAPMELLKNHRMASKTNFRVLQEYLGREIMRNKRGVIPERMSQYVAPIWIVEMLVAGRVSKIHWERLYSEVRMSSNTPLEVEVAKAFQVAEHAYSFVGFMEEIKELAVKVLRAWGWESMLDGEYEGSFARVMDEHKEALQVVHGVQEGPKQNWLQNSRYGAFVRLKRALEDAEENYTSFMRRSPSQVMEAGSVTKVTRALVPFVPAGSRYFEMSLLAEKKKEELAEKRDEKPEEYNSQVVWQGADDAETLRQLRQGVEPPVIAGGSQATELSGVIRGGVSKR